MPAKIRLRKDAFQLVKNKPRLKKEPFDFDYRIRGEGLHRFTYRRFRESDRASVSRIIAPEFNPLRKAYGGNWDDEAVDKIISETIAKVKTKSARVLVEDGKIVGVVGFVLHRPDDLEFGPLFIDPKYKRKGVGAMLTNFLIGEVKASEFAGRVWARTGEDSKLLLKTYFPEAIKSITKVPDTIFYIIELDLSKLNVEFV